jgi:hypothetical protein
MEDDLPVKKPTVNNEGSENENGFCKILGTTILRDHLCCFGDRKSLSPGRIQTEYKDTHSKFAKYNTLWQH